MDHQIPSVIMRFTQLLLGITLLNLVACSAAQSPPNALDLETEPAPCTMVEANVQQPTSVNRALPVVSYLAANNTILVQGSTPTTLPAIAQALKRTDLLESPTAGEWLLKANLVIDRGAALTIAGSEVQHLKLQSSNTGFVSIHAVGGILIFRDTCVTSWDPKLGDVDTQIKNGRSYVLARDGAQMEIYGSELSFLGYNANESWGVSWRMPTTNGGAFNSRFGYNFYGLYIWNASGLVIENNEVHHSERYGIDPHTNANDLRVEGNRSHHNGRHGIILAEGCSNSIIRGNTVYNNQLHGIVLFNGSNENLIAGNTSYNNTLHGINVNNANQNRISKNTIYGNEDGIGVSQNSRNTIVEHNTVSENLRDGIAVVTEAIATRVQFNTVRNNRRYGIYLKATGNILGSDNQVSSNGKGDIVEP
jgi:parallel beta-helix repeat protein